MAIVLMDPKRGYRKVSKKRNDAPRKGLTIRMILKVNRQWSEIAMRNQDEIHILKRTEGKVKGRGGKTLWARRYEVRDDEGTIIDGRKIPRKHSCLVIRQDGVQGPLGDKNVNVIVSCPCERFLFMCEYALTHYGASWIKYSNGAPPNVTNPGLSPFTCKHLNKVLTDIIQKGL